ncbi:MAG: heavy metal-binding domain-containing protein [Bacteroidia bacterium]
MKKIITLFVLTIIFSCSTPPKKDEPKTNQCTEYACPVHLDKTSINPADCPVCGTKMIPADSIAKDSSMLKKK